MQKFWLCFGLCGALTWAGQEPKPLFEGAWPEGGWHYVYGGATRTYIQEQSEKEWRLSLDAGDYSGVALVMGTPWDIEASMKERALSFWVRGDAQAAVFYAGLLDDESDGAGRAVETRVRVGDYAKVKGEWAHVVIPLRDFPALGCWWNADAHANVVSRMDWKRLQGVRFSTDRMANVRPGGAPLELSFKQVELVQVPDSLFNADSYWQHFDASAPDRLLENFSSAPHHANWHTDGPKESVQRVSFPVEGGDTSLRVDYELFPYGSVDATPESLGWEQDWSKWRALELRGKGFERYSRLSVLLVDSSSEAWVGIAELGEDWKSLRLDFSDFRLFEYWQPEEARPNRRLDLEKVRLISLRSMEYGEKGSFAVDGLKLSNAPKPGQGALRKPAVWYNQQGYAPEAVKRAFVKSGNAEEFMLLDSNGRKVLSAPLVYNGVWEMTGDSLYVADFSSYSKPGLYSLWVGDSLYSGAFRIGSKGLTQELRAALKSYYYMRSGMALKGRYAGIYARPKAHEDKRLPFHASMGREGYWNAHGGWYDAGDYGKYVVNGGVAVASLMLAYEINSHSLSLDDLGIPESGNRVPDVLDEARYELEWFLRMQDKDGGLFFKVAPDQWDGFVMPASTHWPRRVVGKSTTSTLNGAAAFAQAAVVYAPFDKRFARRCLKAAQAAYAWAEAHRDIPYPPYTEGSGAYDDSRYEDEFFWAQAMLWRATGDSALKLKLEQSLKAIAAEPSLNWQNTGNLGYIALAMQNRDEAWKAMARSALGRQALALREQMESSAMRVPTEAFGWGSNGEMLNRALTLALQARFEGDKASGDAVQEIVDYVNGRNALGKHFVTGMAASSPLYPHHRLIAADGIGAPIPGLLVGGVNANREDDVTKDPLGVRYPYSEPGLAYYDHQAAYASNETCINWNAPLVLALALLLEQP